MLLKCIEWKLLHTVFFLESPKKTIARLTQNLHCILQQLNDNENDLNNDYYFDAATKVTMPLVRKEQLLFSRFFVFDVGNEKFCAD